MRHTRRAKRRRRRILLAVLAVFTALVLAGLAVWYWLLRVPEWYTAQHFGIETLQSPLDANGNGVDDYTDILLGAREDAQNKPRYDGSYHEGGYPPDNIGVCTDVIWRAFRHAGYELKDLVDADIAAEPTAYPRLDDGIPDPNIDFRRVKNLQVFFTRNAQSFTLDLAETDQWQPGDIVVFMATGSTDHIAIVSDRRNAEGVPWLIHNSGQPNREEDAFGRLLLLTEIVGHYRWNG